ncbi:TonB C-terminal domain-containing protein [Vibrio alginolyticus]|uniref:Lipoprotein n=3 Tax=Vibrio TaxID=662 RepID=A0AAE7AW50_9VIBR|nr:MULTISPECIES: TonB C-terminal domain-containing protein [Vibrio]HCM0860125.1 TonB C-terminal domain-containing protein [Vibrio parahaemolyticus]ELB1091138.1 TonB C-terminal domain-containing protein [Vibrio alginolyticus]ELB1514748.1 TonB C-terminal domain-containing protein [Vibrio alginolyticus]ELB1663705.1 TonB C-terminal domain-containing protein [Vibrio alginolyticus]MCE9824345.1 TonB C-terminal domain-containing protein [Vibrio alginolyticus]
MMRYTVFVAFISIFVAGCVGFHASPESRLIHNSSMMTERIQGALNQQGEYVGLDVRVNFKLDDKAQVTGFSLLKTSGLRSFDNAVEKAVKDSSPFDFLLSLSPEEFKQFQDINLTINLE